MKLANKTKIILYSFVSILILVLIFIFSIYFGCPIRNLLGFPCPACGITRAYISLFQGDLTTALYFHPLFFLLPIMAVLVILLLLSEKKKPGKSTRLLKIISVSLLCLFIAVYLIRLYLNIIP